MDNFFGKEDRLLGVDYGEKRVGIAITDPLMMFASPLKTINNDQRFWEEFLLLFDEYQITKIVLGYPLKESGEASSSTRLVEKFRAELEKRVKVPIEYSDERYSSDIAMQRIIESVPSKKKRRDKGLVDKNAAAIILQDYLDLGS
ncbi:MAG: Holliday junction resolvase RuvX [Bacteroidetes bacterium]|nr:Holliday junction resolvase RuvX [Bacteroidota bacterium]